MKRDFVSARPHTPLREIAALFFESGEAVLPVTEDDGSFLGIITLDDFILIFLPDYLDMVRNIDFIHNFGALEKTSFSVEEMLFVAEDLMREDVRTLEEKDSVLLAGAVLHREDLARVPVVSDGRLTGMIGRTEICRAIYDTEGQN